MRNNNLQFLRIQLSAYFMTLVMQMAALKLF